MAERDPHDLKPTPLNPNLNPDLNTDLNIIPNGAQLPFTPGTYIVQVPKDQIHRVPPPGNALIAEKRRNAADKRRRRTPCGFSLLTCSFVSFFAVLVIIGLIVGISFLSFKPEKPNFQIKQLSFDNPNKRSQPKFKIKVNIENPNGNSVFSYKDGDFASISFKKQEIGHGTFPGLSQDGSESNVVSLVLDVANHDLSKEFKNVMKGNKSKKNMIFLNLKMDLSVNAKKGIVAKDLKIVVTCNMALDTLDRSTKILSQNCETRS